MSHWILCLLILAPLSAFAENWIYIADICSKKETLVTTPNGVKLMVHLSGLSPRNSVDLRVTFRPSLSAEQLQSQDKVIWNLRYGTNASDWLGRDYYYVNANGELFAELFLPKSKWMRNVEERHKGLRLWDVEVYWSQPESDTNGNIVTTFYNTPDEGPFFQVLSRRLCGFEGEAEVSSKLFRNDSNSLMQVTKTIENIFEEGSTRGMTLGYNNFEDGINPLQQFSSSSLALGWLFREWENQSGTSNTSGIEVRYALNRYEVGVFTSRMSYSRHRVKKFVWDKTIGKCGNFAPVSEGVLDVGRKSDGHFVVVPPEYMGKPELLRAFINKILPPVGNCRDHEEASDIITSKNGILTYYANP